MICEKCKMILLNEAEEKDEKLQAKCQDCGHFNIFKSEIYLFDNKDVDQMPPYLENYKYDDTILNGKIILNDRYYDIEKKEYVK